MSGLSTDEEAAVMYSGVVAVTRVLGKNYWYVQ